MILDKLRNGHHYTSYHPRLKQAFDYLLTTDLKSLSPGSHEIDGKEIFIIVAEDKRTPETKQNEKLEVHRKYIDIQLSIIGSFPIGWRGLEDCNSLDKPYNEENDYLLYSDHSTFEMTVGEGEFAIFYPFDAHSPQPPKDYVKKAIVKVAV
ncbi:MAG: YhcH/YjgK/YiaL family protein [Chloroherpetonaceae bacterium]|nr:YhcH/YjgK/YiaL family protein [Chloroherpetonaceae bacterium]